MTIASISNFIQPAGVAPVVAAGVAPAVPAAPVLAPVPAAPAPMSRIHG